MPKKFALRLPLGLRGSHEIDQDRSVLRSRRLGMPDEAGIRASAAARAGHDLLHADILVLGTMAWAAWRAVRVSGSLWFRSRLAGVTRSAGSVEDVHTILC